MSDEEMLAVAESGSLEQHQAFLQAHPYRLNEHFFYEKHDAKYTLLTWACEHGSEQVVEFLLSLPYIDVNMPYIDEDGYEYTALDWAMLKKHVSIAYTLLGRDASHRGLYLKQFLRDHPSPQERARREQEEKKKLEEELARVSVALSASTQQWMLRGTLNQMSEETIVQELVEGRLACGFSDHPTWPDIAKRVEERESEHALAQQKETVIVCQQEQAAINARRQEIHRQVQRLQEELALLTQQYQELEQRIQTHAQPPAKVDLSELLAFAQRVAPIEQRVVAQLEEEMNKKNFQLAALSNKSSSQPKLSLLLNCMGVGEAAIAVTHDLDSNAFRRLTERNLDFFERYRSRSVSMEDIKDMLYCGEMMRKAEFPYVDHDVACAVCANHTAQQLVNFVQEREDIDLPLDVLRSKNINGRRALFCMLSEFPTRSKQELMKAMDRLYLIHETAMS